MAKGLKIKKGTPPSEKKTDNLNVSKNPSDTFVSLNFKVDPSFRKEFRSYASSLDIPMKDLLERCFKQYKENN